MSTELCLTRAVEFDDVFTDVKIRRIDFVRVHQFFAHEIDEMINQNVAVSFSSTSGLATLEHSKSKYK